MDATGSAASAPLRQGGEHDLPGRRLGTRYWRLWVASCTANLGDGVLVIALP
jgi:hypothetical protein